MEKSTAVANENQVASVSLVTPFKTQRKKPVSAGSGTRKLSQFGVSRRMDTATSYRREWMTLLLAACVFFAAHGMQGQASAAASATSPSTSPASTGQNPAAQGPGAGAPVAADALPAWDVSTVKPSSSDARGSMIQFAPDGIRITNVPLNVDVREAFGVEDDHLLGMPSWAKTAMFDIEAKVAPEDAPRLKGMKVEQRREMWVALLEGRFGLKFHHETKELPVYELVVAKGGAEDAGVEA